MSSLLRSTKFVRYFTGAARTLILNSAKTAEVNTLINTKTLSASNDILKRDYATSKKTENLEPLLQRLDSEVRRFGRISKRDIEDVFDEIRSKSDITSSQSLLVIRCCGELVPEELPEQRTLLVQKIWNVLTERGIPMDISHYNALLRVYIENEHPFSPAKFLEELEKKGLQPNRVTYQRLMWRYCQEGDVEGATKVLEKMRELNMPVSEPVLNALVMGHAFHGDTDGAKAVLETMAGAGLQPTNRTYSLLACGYARNGDIDGINNVIKSSTDRDILMTDKDILDIIEHLTIGGHGDKCEQLFDHIQKSVGYNQDVCNLILRLLNKGHIETAKAVMKTMPKSINIDDTPFKGAFFVKQVLKVCKDSDTVIKVCAELKEENLVPNAFYIATETALLQGHCELAQKLFREIEKEGIEIRQHYYWPLLVQKGKEGDEEGLLHILKIMSAQGLVPNGETIRDYVIPYFIKKDSPRSIILKLQVAGISPINTARNLVVDLLDSNKIKEAYDITLQYRLRGQYSLIARPLLNALNKTKEIESFVSILHVMSSKPQFRNEDESGNEEARGDDGSHLSELGRLVKSAVKILSKPELVENLLNSLFTKGIRISTDSAEDIQQYLDKNLTSKISELLTQLTSTDLEAVAIESTQRSNQGSIPRSSNQIETFLEQLKTKGGNVSRVQKQLLAAYIQENNVQKLDSYLEELKASNFELTAATYAQLFEFYCNNNELEKAKQCQAEVAVKHPDFAINRYKLLLMASALIGSNNFEEAIKYLKDNKPKEELENAGFMVNSKCWQMLNELAEQKEDAKVLELTKTLIEYNYTEPSTVILGPSIKVYLLKDDLESALKQFDQCCNQYRSTPWKGELMKALIMKEDATKLQWLADLGTQIHGEVNILHDLVLAFIECGRLRQARRILETPGMHTRQRRLDDACQRYVVEGKSEHLESLLEATKELSHIDRSKIFYHLLKSYCKADETDKALGLWTLLQEEGEVPSDDFLLHLGKHLTAKGRAIPFVMPEQDQVTTTTKDIPKVARKADDSFIRPTKSEISNKIENLVNDGKAAEAVDEAIKAIRSGVAPNYQILKHLLSALANDGNVEKIEAFSSFLTDSMRRRISYDNKLTLAKVNRGNGHQHVEELLTAIQTAKTVEEIEPLLQKFPKSNALAQIIENDELLNKCHKIAEIAAEKGYIIPINLLWMEYILMGKNQQADDIYKRWLSNSSSLLFRRLLQESHVRNEPKHIENLIEKLSSNKLITMGPLGNAYSRLIGLHLTYNNVELAETALKQAIEKGLQSEHLNKNTIAKLKNALQEAGKEFNYFE